MSAHIDIPLDVIDTMIMRLMAGDTSYVLGSLRSIHELQRDPEVRSNFEINATSLVRHQINRIEELENAAKQFEHDIATTSDIAAGFRQNFREWLVSSKDSHNELVGDLVMKK